MLSKAVSKSSRVDWSKFDVEKTGFQSNYFDGAMYSLAIHHFPDLSNAFKEIARILKSMGKMVAFTVTSEQMPSLQAISNAVEPYGLKIETTIPFYIEPKLEDFFLYSGKQRPEIYLAETVRNGISSFRNLCSQQELEQGLINLQKDIESGAIDDVIKKYANKLGDYLFVLLSKN